MKAVFVNHSHPDLPHVSSMRARYFAESLARMGHQVIVMTATMNESDDGPAPDELLASLNTWDWNRPFHLPCRPATDMMIRVQRKGRLPSPVRKFVTAGMFVFRKGVFSDWVKGSKQYWRFVAEEFGPDVTWGIFGNSDALVIAQGIARLARCPWVMDFKDGWDPFIPPPLRRPLSCSFRDAAAVTVNSEYQAEVVRRYFDVEPRVIYSGVAQCFFEARTHAPCGIEPRLTLVGSVYNDRNLAEFVEGVRLWLVKNAGGDGNPPVFTYAGKDAQRVARAAVPLGRLCRVEINNWLPLETMAEICARSAANAYIWSPSGFHHKFLELLAVGRPIIAFPAEREESLRLARRTGGALQVCGSAEEVTNFLARVCSRQTSDKTVNFGSSAVALSEFTWDAQACRLGGVLEVAAKVGRRPSSN